MRARVTCALVASMVVAACGGGGPSGPRVQGTGFASATGPGDTERYFPAAIGNEWVYDATEGGGPAPAQESISTLTVTGRRAVMGVDAYVLTETNTALPGETMEQFFDVRAGGITRLGDNDETDPITRQIVPYVELAFPAVPGNVSSVTAANLPVGPDPAGNPLVANLTQRVDNVGFEAVTVAAGRFTHALKQVTQLDGAIVDAALQMEVPFSATETRWLVPGVGMVKRHIHAALPGVEADLSTVELRGHRVDGVRRGLGVPFDAIPELGPRNLTPNPPNADLAMATDGDRFLVVARQATGASHPYGMRWIASLLAADGSVLANADLGALDPLDNLADTAQAAVSFDGQAYLVAYTHDAGPAQDGSAPALVAVRVSRDGVRLSDPQPLATGRIRSPVLAFDGTRHLVAYLRTDPLQGLSRVEGLFVSAADASPQGAAFPISPAPGAPGTPAIAHGNGRYLVAWNQQAWAAQPTGVFAARVAQDGAVLDPAAIPVLETSTCCLDHRPAAHHDGTDFVVAWRDFRLQQDNLHTQILVGRITDGGALRDGTGRAVTTALGATEGAPRLAAGADGETLLLWSVMPPTHALWDLRMARLLPDGSVVTSSELGTPVWKRTELQFPALAGHASGAMAAWIEGGVGTGGTPSRVRALRIHPFAR